MRVRDVKIENEEELRKGQAQQAKSHLLHIRTYPKDGRDGWRSLYTSGAQKS